MDCTHLSVEGGGQIRLEMVQSIIPHSISGNPDDYSSIDDQSEILSRESIDFQRKEIVMSKVVGCANFQETYQEKGEQPMAMQNNSENKNEFESSNLEDILDTQKPNKMSTPLRLAGQILFKPIESEGDFDEKNQKTEEKKKRKKKSIRQSKFTKDFEEDNMFSNNQQKYLLEKIQILSKQRNQLTLKNKIMEDILVKRDFQNIPSNPRNLADTSTPTQRIPSELPVKQPKGQPNLIGEDLEASISLDNREISSQISESSYSVQTKVKNQYHLEINQNIFDPFSSFQTNYSKVESQNDQIIFGIPQNQIGSFPEGRPVEYLNSLARQLFVKIGQTQVDSHSKIKIVGHPNGYLMTLNPLMTILWKKDGSFYLGGWRNDCKNGLGFEIKPMRHKYKGYFLNGKRHGKGQLKSIDGTRYFGDWIHGKKQGFGKQIDNEGNVYFGEWEKNQYHGKGTYISQKRGIFNGEFRNGMKHGKILWHEKTTGGDKFEGQYMHDEKNGYGEYFWENGQTYKGEFNSGFKVQSSQKNNMSNKRKVPEALTHEKPQLISEAITHKDEYGHPQRSFYIRQLPKITKHQKKSSMSTLNNPKQGLSIPSISLKKAPYRNNSISNKIAQVENEHPLTGRTISLNRSKIKKKVI